MSYYGFGYDEEAIYQDADIEMMELREQADREWCRPCKSTGWVRDSGNLGGEKPCPTCGGTGVNE